jgi:hypothetical protein
MLESVYSSFYSRLMTLTPYKPNLRRKRDKNPFIPLFAVSLLVNVTFSSVVAGVDSGSDTDFDSGVESEATELEDIESEGVGSETDTGDEWVSVIVNAWSDVRGVTLSHTGETKFEVAVGMVLVDAKLSD